MAGQLTAEQHEMARVLERLLAAREDRRGFLDGGPALDCATWRQLADLGFLGLSLPESAGGPGGSVLDEVILAEALGRANAAVPVVTPAVAAAVLAAFPGSGAASSLATRLTGGSDVVAAGISASTGFDLPVAVQDPAGSPLISGAVGDLIEGAAATVMLLPVRHDGGTGWYGVELTRAVAREQPSLDPSQRLLALTLSQTPAAAVGWVPDASPDGQLAGSLALTLLAAEATGAAARALELTVGWAKDREAFGHPIGYFQAIKHRLAEMLVLVENARSATYNAAWAIDAGRPDAAVAAHMAKAMATENAVRIVHDAIQSHGGIGFTWEHDLHLYLRRSKSCALILGDPDEHFEAVAAAILGPLPAPGTAGAR
jgi:alkylation response protein AidB-like acyl-CoA dehydrogenase